ncbi:hypothetical protein [Candidatus Palauibacter sp.]|uniref:hypothetical protein n=1 Tax=Candidatus Palauibacter sp. TaxID=3101350 RepID=UPI003B5C0D42
MNGGRVFGVLLRNEWFKARKRIAFWMALGFFTFGTVGTHAYPFFQRSEGFNLPGAWGSVFGGDSGTLLIFSALTLLLIATTEFTWRTARQNVIDGLSKSQWFWGKSLLLPILGFAFIGVQISIPAVLALIRTDFGAVDGPLVPASVFAATGGLVLAFLSVAALAFFLSLAIRKTGAALGVWVLWVGPVEFGTISPLVTRYLPDYADWLDYMPWRNALQLLDFRSYDAPTFERFVAAAEAAGRSAPSAFDPTWHLVAAAAWTALFIGTAFIWFRRRDL